MLLTWHGHGAYRAQVETVDPPRAFAFRWLRREFDEPGDGASTLVEITLAAEGAGTRLRVVETGFDDLSWPREDRVRYADENAQGWRHELAELRDYVTRLGASRDES
jgi:hypothetical protein